MDPTDDAAARRFTLPHELGHVRGLPDEYLEPFEATARSCSPAPSILDAKAKPPRLETRARATMGVKVDNDATTVIDLATDEVGSAQDCQVTLHEDNVHNGLMRIALQGTTTGVSSATLANGAPLQPTDFSAVAGWVAQKLGRSAGTLGSFG